MRLIGGRSPRELWKRRRVPSSSASRMSESGDEPRDEPWVLKQESPECPPGWRTGPPDFVGIGAQRSGTSWWYRDALQAHPRVAVVSGQPKEIHFFDRYVTNEVEDDIAERYARFFPRPAGFIAGEWTPDYMYAPWNLPLLAEAAPEARCLIMLRDPIDRFRSEVSPALRGLVESGLNALTMLAIGNSLFHSLYHDPVQRAFDVLGRDRVLVLQYEQCLENPLMEMQRTQRFLGLEPVKALPAGLAVRERSQLRIFPDAKLELPVRINDHLREAFVDDARKLTTLCRELDSGLWRNFSDL